MACLAPFPLAHLSHLPAWQGFEVVRLKDKLGTRQLPTAELQLVGMRALKASEVVARICGQLLTAAPLLSGRATRRLPQTEPSSAS